VVGIERGQRCSDHLARIDIEDDAGRALGLAFQHAPAEFVFQRPCARASIDSATGSCALRRIGQARFQHLLHADLALARQIDEAQHVRRQRALRIVTLVLAREFQRGFAQREDVVGLFGQDALAQVAWLVRFQAADEIVIIRIGKDLDQRAPLLRAS
jgi:hypothetical protein